MCSICGYRAFGNLTNAEISDRIELLNKIFNEDLEDLNRTRGRDSWGITAIDLVGRTDKFVGRGKMKSIWPGLGYPILLANFRAEPTNEYVPDKSFEKLKQDQQPYEYEYFVGTHNGTIYNDDEILEGIERPTTIDSYAVPVAYAKGDPDMLRGGMATAVYDKFNDELHLYHNYNPLYVYMVKQIVIWCSLPLDNHFIKAGIDYQKIDLPYYSGIMFSSDGVMTRWKDERPNEKKAVVCLSGGLDSTVAATVACQENDEIKLVYFDYGCKANSSEQKAITNIANALIAKFPEKKIELNVLDASFIKKLGGSTLTDENASIGEGKAAVEDCIDWVPARNTAFFGMLAAYCDRYDIGNIYAGLNLEESGAYSDNSYDFYDNFEKVLKAGTKARPSIRMPLGTLMKHEIVKLGIEIGAPIEHSWSCYRSGEIHCGECGPCYLRRKAFHMNGIEDLIKYAKDYEGMSASYPNITSK